jgi:hypothetical protein
MYHAKVKRILPTLLITLLLSSCNGWIVQPLPSNPPTPFLPFTPMPSIFTQTPVIIGVASATHTPAVLTSTPLDTNTPLPTLTDQPAFTPTLLSTATPVMQGTATTDTNGLPSVSVKVLGCNTSIDVTHGMGEVTNAFVMLTNTGTIQLTHIKVTLNALDEGRVHPDKTVELTSLPIGYQVTVKLTVDTTYQQDTPIQVATVSDQGTFPIEGLASCTDLGLFAPKPDGLNTPLPPDL